MPKWQRFDYGIEMRRQLISSSANRTRHRLYDAAAEALNRDGIHGATTRQIARRAGVSEVTLFRHFKSKEKLFCALLQNGATAQIAVLEKDCSWKEHLRESLNKYAHQYSNFEKKDSAGAFLAEELFWPESMRAAVAEIIRPVRERLVSILVDAQKAGVIRIDLSVECALDAFKSALYAGILRETACRPLNYSNNVYTLTVVEIFMRGIEASNKSISRS